MPSNYLEASDDIGKADEKMKIKIARRESKESALFLRLVLIYDERELEIERSRLWLRPWKFAKYYLQSLRSSNKTLNSCALFLVPCFF